jgi:hypothetical protein
LVSRFGVRRGQLLRQAVNGSASALASAPPLARRAAMAYEIIS